MTSCVTLTSGSSLLKWKKLSTVCKYWSIPSEGPYLTLRAQEALRSPRRARRRSRRARRSAIYVLKQDLHVEKPLPTQSLQEWTFDDVFSLCFLTLSCSNVGDQRSEIPCLFLHLLWFGSFIKKRHCSSLSRDKKSSQSPVVKAQPYRRMLLMILVLIAD